MTREPCPSKVEVDVERRPANALNIEISVPLARCLNKKPNQTSRDDRQALLSADPKRRRFSSSSTRALHRFFRIAHCCHQGVGELWVNKWNLSKTKLSLSFELRQQMPAT
jgi:hypothetical protein